MLKGAKDVAVAAGLRFSHDVGGRGALYGCVVFVSGAAGEGRRCRAGDKQAALQGTLADMACCAGTPVHLRAGAGCRFG